MEIYLYADGRYNMINSDSAHLTVYRKEKWSVCCVSASYPKVILGWPLLTYLFSKRPFYPLKTSENLVFLLFFYGTDKGCIRNKWVKVSRFKSELYLKISFKAQSLFRSKDEVVPGGVLQFSTHQLYQNIRGVFSSRAVEKRRQPQWITHETLFIEQDISDKN